MPLFTGPDPEQDEQLLSLSSLLMERPSEPLLEYPSITDNLLKDRKDMLSSTPRTLPTFSQLEQELQLQRSLDAQQQSCIAQQTQQLAEAQAQMQWSPANAQQRSQRGQTSSAGCKRKADADFYNVTTTPRSMRYKIKTSEEDTSTSSDARCKTKASEEDTSTSEDARIAIRRSQNALAAQRSRNRRQVALCEALQRITEVERENAQLRQWLLIREQDLARLSGTEEPLALTPPAMHTKMFGYYKVPGQQAMQSGTFPWSYGA